MNRKEFVCVHNCPPRKCENGWGKEHTMRAITQLNKKQYIPFESYCKKGCVAELYRYPKEDQHDVDCLEFQQRRARSKISQENIF